MPPRRILTMSSAPPLAADHPHPTHAPNNHWKALAYFNVYRAAVAGLFLLVILWGLARGCCPKTTPISSAMPPWAICFSVC